MAVPAELAVAPDDEGVGDAGHAVVVEGPALDADTVLHGALRHELLDGLELLIGQGEDHEALIRVLLVQLVEVRDALDTGAAPGGPELDDDDLTLEAREGGRLSRG